MAISNAACSALRFAGLQRVVASCSRRSADMMPTRFPPKHLASLYCGVKFLSELQRSVEVDRVMCRNTRGTGGRLFHMSHVRHSCVALSTRPDKSWRETHVNILCQSWDPNFDGIQIPGKQCAVTLIELCDNFRQITCLGNKVLSGVD
jgi:hypothetical protein